MWESIKGAMTPIVLICAFLSSAVPMIVHVINSKFHQAADPAWKRKDAEQAKINPSSAHASETKPPS